MLLGTIITFLLNEVGNYLIENYSTGFYYFLGQLLTTITLLKKISGQIKVQLGLKIVISIWNSFNLGLKIILVSSLTIILWKLIKFLFTNRI